MKTQYPERTDYFDIIFSEIKRIDFVLSELLVLAKPQSVHFQEVQLHGLLEQVITLLKPMQSFRILISNSHLKAGCRRYISRR